MGQKRNLVDVMKRATFSSKEHKYTEQENLFSWKPEEKAIFAYKQMADRDIGTCKGSTL